MGAETLAPVLQDIANSLRNISQSLSTIANNTSEYGGLGSAIRNQPRDTMVSSALFDISRHMSKFTEEADIVKIVKKRPEQKNNRNQTKQVKTSDADPLEIFKYMYPTYGK